MPVDLLKKTLLLLLVSVTLSACSEGSGSSQPVDAPPYEYAMPAEKADGWMVGHIVDNGFEEAAIKQLINNIQNGTYQGIDSLSIVRNGNLLLHEDFRTELNIYDNWVGNNDLNRHVLHSTSKSFVSALVGIAKDQGYIQDLNRPFYSYFDYAVYDNWDDRKNLMTLENVLTMQLGLEWDEWTQPFGDRNNSLTALTENNNDFVKALLDLPLVVDPGTDYAYNTVASIALGAVVEIATGQPMEDFAEQYLFQPLQIERAEWLMTPTGIPNTGSGLFMQTRDLAKFGVMYMNDGVWNGLQIVSSEWVAESLAMSVPLNWDYTTGYGYQWWLGEFVINNQSIPFYSTRGYGGQFIVLVPDYDLVVAFTAQNYENGLYDSPFKIVERAIIPAIVF
ncbi:serine hydrolase [Aliikangiella marina]|uniref:Serine hydrolase n=1 Tax=Aliikangiella marina TaxID=1712262 RepID=A0A545TCT5_9GAMM|nr:serine hydrolase [Aliikangiella marina]TQV75030.1 serine hydrolase [Aliikangiella marina]